MKKKLSGVLVQVWDPIVRIGHWLIVAGFFIAYVLEGDNLQIHVWAGYVVGTVLVVRLLWGFMGTQNARFSEIVCRPRLVIRYLIDLPRGRSRRYLGHSPAGGAMILALLLGPSVITISGLMVYAYEDGSGPMSAFIEGESEIESSAQGERREEREEFWEELHEIAANFTLALVLLHVLGVLFAGRAHGENLVISMVSGKKYVGPPGSNNKSK